MSPIVVVSYLALCIMVGFLGKSSRLGFFRSFLFSLVLTPIFMTLFLLILTTVDYGRRNDKPAQPPQDTP